mmetsp:Transcript_5031/g.9429  ORF Transcript_5031/g.9429 Transcript_5031/m.9429 type:complete len:208 (-) Transcript_5031:6-629(-)
MRVKVQLQLLTLSQAIGTKRLGKDTPGIAILEPAAPCYHKATWLFGTCCEFHLSPYEPLRATGHHSSTVVVVTCRLDDADPHICAQDPCHSYSSIAKADNCRQSTAAWLTPKGGIAYNFHRPPQPFAVPSKPLNEDCLILLPSYSNAVFSFRCREHPWQTAWFWGARNAGAAVSSSIAGQHLQQQRRPKKPKNNTSHHDRTQPPGSG